VPEYGAAAQFFLAHGATGPFDEAIQVGFIVAGVLGYRAILRTLRKTEDDEPAASRQDRRYEP
jgi:hypothetical protein